MISEKMFILVGGLGTRLRSVVSNVPKPMAPVGGKPFLWYKIMQFKSVGFDKFVFCSGYLSEIIKSYFGDGSQFGVSIEYSDEETPLGTGGAIKHAERYVDGNFFMCNGDTYLEFNPAPMLEFIKEKKAKYCMLLTEPHEKGQEGMVGLDDEWRILEFKEKPKNPGNLKLINAGIYYLNPEILDLIPAGKKVSIEYDIFPKIAGPQSDFYGFLYSGYFIDIGIPKNYKKFCDDVESGRISF